MAGALVCLISVPLLLLLPPASSISLKAREAASDDDILAHARSLFDDPENRVEVQVDEGREGICSTFFGPPRKLDRKLLRPKSMGFLQKRSFNVTHALYNMYDNLLISNGGEVERNFINGIFDTKAMKETIAFLSKKLFLTQPDFKKLLTKLWVTKHPDGFSGFQRVFAGRRSVDVSYIYHDRTTWFRYHILQEDGRLHSIASRWPFSYFNVTMVYGSARYQMQRSVKEQIMCNDLLLVGTVPELEIALYTVCYLLRPLKFCKVAEQGSVNLAIGVWFREEARIRKTLLQFNPDYKLAVGHMPDFMYDDE